jgi:hypothetical protein
MVDYIRRPMDYTDIYATISTANTLHNTFEILLEHQTDANPTLNN